MFGWGKINRVNKIVQLIAEWGDVMADAYGDDECIKFPHGDRWVSFCATIPAFAYVITHETLLKTGKMSATPEQRAFFQSIEEGLFALYRRNGDGCSLPLRKCLRLQTEMTEFCGAYGLETDVIAEPELILGTILSKRLSLYQLDWAYGYACMHPACANDTMYAPVATRFAADLEGIVTPKSLADKPLADFRVRTRRTASEVLLFFTIAYGEAFPRNA